MKTAITLGDMERRGMRMFFTLGPMRHAVCETRRYWVNAMDGKPFFVVSQPVPGWSRSVRGQNVTPAR